jgi:hypothetical protein
MTGVEREERVPADRVEVVERAVHVTCRGRRLAADEQ